MGESIADVVRQHLPADRVEQVSISVHHQLVLSCAWLNIKESAHLASQVGLCLLRHEEALPLEERAAQIDECVRLIGRTLLCCRHKGAIEGAGEALAALCRRLLARAEPPLRAVPGRLLSSLLDRFEQPFVGVSITRRSAGMALLVGKIVASEPAKSERPLVAMATKRLMAVAERPIDESQLDETCDLPQSVAIHMLQVLVHDASLVAAMQPHLASLVRLGVGSLDRGPWPVRNAALQLYGALVPKLTGNTRNRDTPCGAPTTRELFHKLPGLADFLLDQLDQQRRSAGLLGGGLIAVLSLLCRLSPGRDHACNQRFTPHLTALLAHPAAQVRVLASQTLLAFVPLHRTKETTLLLCADALTLAADADAELRVCSVRHSTNGLHGCLAAVAEFLHRCRSVALSVEDWQTIRESVSSLEVIERRHRCHYVKLAVLKLFDAVGVSPAHAPAGADAVQRFLDEASAHRDAGLDAATPGYVPWLRLKTELLLNHSPLDCLLSAVDGVLRLENGPDIVESGLAALTKRVAKLSHSSVLSNSVALKVGACLHGWRHMPSLLAVSLECVLQRGAGALLVTDTSLVFFVDFFLERCIDGRQFGTSTALLALPTAAVVLRDAARKALLPDNVVGPFLLRLSESLLTASRASEAVAYRKACADSLRLAGRIWLEMADKDVQFSRNLFQVVLNLIQDEDRDVRSEATLFLSALLAETPPAAANAGVVDVLSGRCCLRRFAADIGRWFRPLDLLPLIFQLLTSDAVEPDNRPLYADPACSEHFYEPESANFYREEGETADFLVAVAASLAAGAAPTEPLGRHVDVDAALLVDEADRLRRRLDAAAESDAGFGFAESTPLHSALVQWSAKLRVAALCFPPHADRFETLRLQLHQRFVAF